MSLRKTNVSLKKMAAASFLMAGVGCGQANNQSTSTVSAALKMTGSGASATVAGTKSRSFRDLFFTTANALTPTLITDATGTQITLNDAWTVIKEIEFKSNEMPGEEDSSSEVEFKGPYFVDLLSSAPTALDTSMVKSKSIRRIKLKLESAGGNRIPAGAPAALANNSLYFSASISGKSFKIQIDDGTEVKIAGPNAFQPGENSEILIEVQTANIFKQVNLSSIVNNEVIDHTNRHPGSHLCDQIDASATDLYTCFRKGFEKHSDCGEDRNRDGKIEGNEEHVK